MSTLGSWLRRYFGIRDKESQAAVAADRESHPVAWTSMASLLEELEELADEFPELLDTDVRQRMYLVVQKQLLAQGERESVPADLGMFSPEGNTKLQELLERNIRALREVFAIFELDTEKKRRVTFFNSRLHTERGTRVEDFFGQP
jgi:hypothetical protein